MITDTSGRPGRLRAGCGSRRGRNRTLDRPEQERADLSDAEVERYGMIFERERGWHAGQESSLAYPVGVGGKRSLTVAVL